MSTNEVVLAEASEKTLSQRIVEGVKSALTPPKPIETPPPPPPTAAPTPPPTPPPVQAPPAPPTPPPTNQPTVEQLNAKITELQAQLAEKSKPPPPTPAQAIVEPPKDPNEPTTMKERSDLLVAEFKALKPNEQLTWLTHILEFNAKQPRK